MRTLKNPYIGLITTRELAIIKKAEPFRSHFGMPDGTAIVGAWTKRKSVDFPGEAYCPFCGKIHNISAPSTGKQYCHCYRETAKYKGKYFVIRIGERIPDEVERAAKAWSKILTRFIDRVKHSGGQYQQRKFSATLALYFANQEYK